MNLIKLCFLSLLTMVLTACGGEGSGLPSQGGGDGGETVPAIVSLQVTPATATVPVGFEQQYLALATLDDGSVMDVTSNPVVRWSTSNPAVATINNTGLATGLAPGEVIVTASGTANDVPFERKVTLTVTNAVVTALQVTPATATVPVGFEQAFTAIATFSDGSALDVTRQTALAWSSSDATVATIDASKGKQGQATGVAPGPATITATLTAGSQAHSADAALTVTDATITQLRVEPQTVNTPVSVPVGLSLQFHAIATFSDGHEMEVTNQPAVSWSTDNSAIASIDDASNKGLALGVTPGDVIVTATGTANGKTLTATGTLKVTNATVLSLSVTPFNRSVPVGFNRQFTATASLSDGTSLDVTTNTALNWRSSDPTVATIENFRAKKGQATGVTPGAVTIIASGTANRKPFSATTALTVTSAQLTNIVITPETAVVAEGETQPFVATGMFSDSSSGDITNSVTWNSDNLDAATIDTAGVATGVAEGGTAISASKDGITSNTASLTVTVNGPNVVTWGNINYGADSSLVQPQLLNVTSITGNRSAFAAIKTDGSVVTWGDDSSGGNSDSVQTQMVNIVSVAASGSAFAAIKGDGSVVTWGTSSSGGDSSVVATQLTSGVVSITGTTRGAFAALKTDGSVVTWGGIGGDSSSVASLLASGVTSISSTGYAFAAIKTDGSVVTWGGGPQGGDSSNVASSLTGGVLSITGNDDAFAALKTDGTVITWGIFGDGGNSSTVQSQLNNVTSIASSNRAFAAIKTDGSVVTWGSSGTLAADSSSVQAQLTTVQSITGANDAFAAIKADGSVVTWGSASGGGDSSAVSDQLTNGVSSIVSTSTAFAAIKTDGSVVTWGSASNGGNSSDVQLQLTGVTSIAAASFGAFAAIR